MTTEIEDNHQISPAYITRAAALGLSVAAYLAGDFPATESHEERLARANQFAAAGGIPVKHLADFYGVPASEIDKRAGLVGGCSPYKLDNKNKKETEDAPYSIDDEGEIIEDGDEYTPEGFDDVREIEE